MKRRAKWYMRDDSWAFPLMTSRQAQSWPRTRASHVSWIYQSVWRPLVNVNSIKVSIQSIIGLYQPEQSRPDNQQSEWTLVFFLYIESSKCGPARDQSRASLLMVKATCWLTVECPQSHSPAQPSHCSHTWTTLPLTAGLFSSIPITIAGI